MCTVRTYVLNENRPITGAIRSSMLFHGTREEQKMITKMTSPSVLTNRALTKLGNTLKKFSFLHN